MARTDLHRRAFPAANVPILSALRLPCRYLITPEPGDDWDVWLDALAGAARRGCPLIQLRAPQLNEKKFEALADQALLRLRNDNVRLLLNAEPETARRLGTAGVHLNGRRLADLARRPLGEDFLVSASCHGENDLQKCVELGLDFAVLSPLKPTASHPGAPALGWSAFARLVDGLPLPVYALGGLSDSDLDDAWGPGLRVSQPSVAYGATWVANESGIPTATARRDQHLVGLVPGRCFHAASWGWGVNAIERVRRLRRHG